jgi:HEAT repeat protein
MAKQSYKESYKEIVEAVLSELSTQASFQRLPPETMRRELRQRFRDDPWAIDALLAIAGDKKSTQTISALAALEELRPRTAVPTLASMLQDGGHDSIVRAQIAQVLGEIGDWRGIEALAAATAEGGFIGYNAVEALSKIEHPKAVESLIRAATKKEMEDSVRRAMEGVNGRYALCPLCDAISHDALVVREIAVAHLAVSKDPDALRALVVALADTDPWVRGTAAEGLVAGGRSAVQPLSTTLLSENPVLREAGALCLGRIKDPGASPGLVEVLADSEPSVRIAAANALGAIRAMSAVDSLIGMLSDGAPKAKQAARVALERITGKFFFIGGGSPEKWKKWWDANKDRVS